jgi:periplasmic protein TonB
MARMLLVALLLGSTAPALAGTSSQGASAGTDSEKIICKRQVKTGTLASYEKTCLSKADWQRLRTENRSQWEEMQGSKGSTSGK